MEKIRTYTIKAEKPSKQFGVPRHWFREYLPDGGELELYQDGDKLILMPKKRVREKVGAK